LLNLADYSALFLKNKHHAWSSFPQVFKLWLKTLSQVKNWKFNIPR